MHSVCVSSFVLLHVRIDNLDHFFPPRSLPLFFAKSALPAVKCQFWGFFFSNARRKWPSALTCIVSMATFHVSTLVLGIHVAYGV